MPQTHRPSVRIIKANRALQRRVGTGMIDTRVIAMAEHAMKHPEIDFTPIARGFLEHLELAILHAGDSSVDTHKRIDIITRPIMDLKANARMFGYGLVTALTNIMLGLLEAVPDINADTLQVLGAHHRSLGMIIDQRIMGDGGEKGTALIQELRESCDRYTTKYRLPPIHISLI